MMKTRSERGQTAVEFALVIPVMLLFLLGIFQIGITYYNNESLDTSARDGARAGAIHTGSTPLQISNFVDAAVRANAVGLNTATTTLVVSSFCWLPPATAHTDCNQGDTIDVTVTYPWKIGVLAFSQSGTLSTHTTLRME
jgi:Flp pilus assembly protein TadG